VQHCGGGEREKMNKRIFHGIALSVVMAFRTPLSSSVVPSSLER
jgi:hypothetical protein